VLPSPRVAFPCGSQSTSSTSRSSAASAAPRLIAVVVFPTPPFWLATARIVVIGRVIPEGSTLCDQEPALQRLGEGKRLREAPAAGEGWLLGPGPEHEAA